MRFTLLATFLMVVLIAVKLATGMNTSTSPLILPTPSPTSTAIPAPTIVKADPTPRPVATRRPVIIQRVDLNTIWGAALEGIGLTVAEAAEIIEYRCQPASNRPYFGELVGCPPGARGIVTIGELVDRGIFTEERAIDLRLTEITVQTWD